MGDITLINLGDPDDETTITREQYRRWRDLCLYCGSRRRLRSQFCSRRCRRLWRRIR